MDPFQQYGNDFGLIDFMDAGNFDQYADLIHGENEHNEPFFNYSYDQGYNYQDHNNNAVPYNVDGHFFPAAVPPSAGLFDFDVAGMHVADNNNQTDFSLLNARQNLEAAEEEILLGEEESSGSGGTTTTEANNEASKTTNSKSDRSRTLVSERKRRSRMKEKLYALRSLVPNITKMDKASIVGDAVLYVKDMQMQATKLKAEIASLESSLAGGDNNQDKATQSANSTNFYPIIKKIFKMDVIQVDERGFYVSIVSNKGKGVAMFLYKALESLTSFNIHNSNLAASADNYVLTFTLHMAMHEEINVNIENMKLWIVSVFLNQGFEFQMST